MNELEQIDKSIELIQKSMENVIAEYIITLEDGSTHIVYITKFEVVKGEIVYESCTPDQTRAEELDVHVKKIFQSMMKTYTQERKLLSF